MNSTKKIRDIFSKEEIQLSEIWALFWDRKKYLLYSIVFFVVTGTIQALTMPQEYAAKCVLLGEEDGGSGGGSSALQALAGMSGSNAASAQGGGGISDLYPIILSNQPFLEELSKDTVYLNDSTRTTLFQYFQKPPKEDAITSAKIFFLNLPGKIIGSVKSLFQSPQAPADKETVVKKYPKKNDDLSNYPDTIDAHYGEDSDFIKSKDADDDDEQVLSIVKISQADIAISSILKVRITLTKTGRQVTIAVRMPEARLSAEAAKLVLNKLIKYVIKYKTDKQLQNLRFLEARVAEASSRYKSNQKKVAGFNDNNYGVIYQTVKSKEEQLRNEFNISFSTYNQLAGQLEQARIDLKKQTPLFTILEPVYIPLDPAPISKLKIIGMHIAISIAMGMIIIFGELVFLFIREKKK